MKSHFSRGDGGQQAIVQKLLKNIEGKAVPDKVMKVIEEEMQRFTEMDKMHSEYQNLKTYLEYLTKMPYGVHSEDNFDIKMAKSVLDEGHYGM